MDVDLMTEIIVSVDLVLMLGFIGLGWYRLFSLTVACVVFVFLHNLPNLSEFNAVVISAVSFMLLADTLLRLEKAGS